jgi:hypothetical protein
LSCYRWIWDDEADLGESLWLGLDASEDFVEGSTEYCVVTVLAKSIYTAKAAMRVTKEAQCLFRIQLSCKECRRRRRRRRHVE